MNAVLISIGTELTGGLVQDTNRSWLSRELDAAGIRTAIGLTAPDSREAISRALIHALRTEPDLVVLTGGLGPTSDDVTSSAVAAALNLELEMEPEAQHMVARSSGHDRLEPHEEKQATMPAGSIPVAPAGTAPGYILFSNSMPIVVLPGVPWEMKQMWEAVTRTEAVNKVLAEAEPHPRRSACFYDSGEPRVSRAADGAFSELRHLVELSICAHYREVELEVTYPESIDGKVKDSIETMKQELAEWYYSDGEPVEAITGSLLARKGLTLAVGESCTGGLLCGTITRYPGSSKFFLGGVTAYSNEVKMSMLGVRREALDNVGAVSEPVAQQLALGARSATGADYGIGVTGIAGPSGGSIEKPVGLVFICVSSEAVDIVERFDFPGDREDVRRAAVVAALHMLHGKLSADDE